jgi:hypothetical protein
MLRILALLEHDFHRDSLHHLDVIPSGILGRQQTVASARGPANVEDMPIVGPAVSVHENFYGLPGLHIGQLRLFEISGYPDVFAIQRDDRHELLARRNVLARLHCALTHDSADRRHYSRVLQIELRLLQSGLCLLRLGVGRLGPRLL